jgi:hypothetical protein
LPIHPLSDLIFYEGETSILIITEELGEKQVFRILKALGLSSI